MNDEVRNTILSQFAAIALAKEIIEAHLAGKRATVPHRYAISDFGQELGPNYGIFIEVGDGRSMHYLNYDDPEATDAATAKPAMSYIDCEPIDPELDWIEVAH